MIAWQPPSIPDHPGAGQIPSVHDTSSGQRRPAAESGRCRLYVCGITPYDATHLGHAATYVAFDLLVRALRDAGVSVTYTQNVTDVDEPLFERARRDAMDWRDLARREISLFREDMTALAVIPPDHYIGVEEAMPVIAATVARLVDTGLTYQVPVEEGAGEDLYLDLAQVPSFGEVSGWSREQMLAVFGERGGDPQRPGKRDPLDPLLWRAQRPGEPSWELAGLGPGRPGWHVECTAIAQDSLGLPFDIQGGGSDLVFPHHEMSQAQADGRFARIFLHQGMVAYQGEKMSKSRGNLVFVSRLRAQGVEPVAIRLVLLAQHYRSDWEFSQTNLDAALDRLMQWRAALALDAGPAAQSTLTRIRAALADDLDAPSALLAVDDWCTRARGAARGSAADLDPAAPGMIAHGIEALLGVRA